MWRRRAPLRRRLIRRRHQQFSWCRIVGVPNDRSKEFVRILTPGGHLSLTTWDLPERARLVGVFLDAIAEAGAAPPDDIPGGPPFFRFADEEQFAALLEHGGLTGVEVNTIVFEHHVSTADEPWNGFLGGTVRISAPIVRQPEEYSPAHPRRVRPPGCRMSNAATGSIFPYPSSLRAAPKRDSRPVDLGGLMCQVSGWTTAAGGAPGPASAQVRRLRWGGNAIACGPTTYGVSLEGGVARLGCEHVTAGPDRAEDLTDDLLERVEQEKKSIPA